jgi:hypothetical protein
VHKPTRGSLLGIEPQYCMRSRGIHHAHTELVSCRMVKACGAIWLIRALRVQMNLPAKDKAGVCFAFFLGLMYVPPDQVTDILLIPA